MEAITSKLNWEDVLKIVYVGAFVLYIYYLSIVGKQQKEQKLFEKDIEDLINWIKDCI